MGDAPDPYVSIVLTGRNDGYGGDFVTRFLGTLRFNHAELSARVEWAPPASAPLLADLAEATCDASVASSLHTVVVDPAYHQAVSLNSRVAYHEFLAKNVGIRRARGAFVITTNCDIFLGRHILEQLQQRSLRTGLVYRASRYDLHANTQYDGIDWAYLEDPVHWANGGRRLRPPHFSGATGDFIALDSGSFTRVRGFNEIYRVARVGVDRNFLSQALSCGLSIVDIGGPVYHVNHEGSYRVTRERYIGRECEAPYGDERWHARSVVYRNPQGWGLADAPERRTGRERTYLDFSWDAVPPLVDLAGIVLPLSRSRAVGSEMVLPEHE
jgi:hypothetical protein